MSEQAAIAANRFGFGATSDGLAQIARDPKGWLKGQIARDVPLPKRIAALPKTGADQLAIQVWTASIRQNDQMGTRSKISSRRSDRMMRSGRSGAKPVDGLTPMQAGYRRLINDRYVRAVGARFKTAVETDMPFRERLVHFWSNHFVVSGSKQAALAMVPSYERDVARAHVGHTFYDMLVASCQHPAMLFYLDNWISVGPNSVWSKNPSKAPAVTQSVGRPKGLNENLAREILELHTMGVDGGYTQADVTDFAKIITGWGMDLRPGINRRSRAKRAAFAAGDIFYFNAEAHEPGPQTVLGKVYDQSGVDQGLVALRDLSRHPSTARFIATKLARYFVADDPPQELVQHLSRVFLDTDGDLPSIYEALIDAPQAWQPELQKIKRPEEYLISTVRLLGGPDLEGGHVVRLLDQMGEPPYRQGGPDGWADQGDQWSGPDALWKRIEWAKTAALHQASTAQDPLDLAKTAFGPLLSDTTRRTISGAESPEQGLAILLSSPEMLRR